MVRLNLHGIILPTGQIFFAFGVRTDTTNITSPEVYTPAIDWSAGRYETDEDGVALPGTWQTLTGASVRTAPGLSLRRGTSTRWQRLGGWIDPWLRR